MAPGICHIGAELTEHGTGAVHVDYSCVCILTILQGKACISVRYFLSDTSVSGHDDTID